MNTPVHAETAGHSRHFGLLALGWVLIALKCVLVTWAIERWQVPVHPLWVVGPTLLFAGLVTVLWTAHRE